MSIKDQEAPPRTSWQIAMLARGDVTWERDELLRALLWHEARYESGNEEMAILRRDLRALAGGES